MTWIKAILQHSCDISRIATPGTIIIQIFIQYVERDAGLIWEIIKVKLLCISYFCCCFKHGIIWKIWEKVAKSPSSSTSSPPPPSSSPLPSLQHHHHQEQKDLRCHHHRQDGKDELWFQKVTDSEDKVFDRLMFHYIMGGWTIWTVCKFLYLYLQESIVQYGWVGIVFVFVFGTARRVCIFQLGWMGDGYK